MSNQSQLETVMGNRNYSLESAFNGLGSQVSLKLLRRRCLVLPPQIKSATDTANIHYEGVTGVNEFAYAYGMISEAESFLDNWPMRNRDFSRTTRAWSLSGVNGKLMVAATPEWVALTNMISLNEAYGQTLDESVKQERLAVYQRWWGLVAPPNPAKYTDLGIAVTDEITDPPLDDFSGYGRKHAHQYYPTATQAFLSNRVELLRVKHLTENKRGRITSIKTVDGSVVVYPTQCPYQVDVQWDDGSTETLSYLLVRHLDPVIGEPMYCRAQQNLSPVDYFGNTLMDNSTSPPEPLNDFVNKLASVLVIAAMDIGFAHTTLSGDNIVRKWTNLSAPILQTAARSITYNNIEDLSSSIKRVGWETDRGQRIMADIWNVFMTGAGINDIGKKVGQFLDRIIVLPLGTVKDSGLVLCPNCKKCETINNAEFVDFGIQTNDQDGFSSIKWQTRNVDGEQKFKAVGVVKCSGCSSLYFRKFSPSLRPFENQVPIGRVNADNKPNLFIDASRQGGTAANAPITGYTFLPRFRKGSSGADGLPSLRVFGELEGVKGQSIIRADDIPLEVGTQSRNLKKQRWCSGQTPISFASSMTSHEWYDKNVMDNDGLYAGDNCEIDNYSINNRTGMPRCSWCEAVSTRINRYMSETWITGSGSFSFYSATESQQGFLELKSANNNDIFNTSGVDYKAIGGEEIDLGDGIILEEPETILYYKIRLLGEGGLIKELQMRPSELGQEIPALDSSPSIILKPFDVVCPNEDRVFLTPYRAFYEDYLEKEQKELNQESRFLVTEQLAYSAKLNTASKKWEAQQPPSSYLKELSGYGDNLFTSVGVPSLEWKEGNRDSITPQGNKPRFPEIKMGLGTAATIITPYADNRVERPLKQYHIMKQVGQDVEVGVDEESGEKTTTITPYFYCPQCNDSFHGAPSLSALEKSLHKSDETSQEKLATGMKLMGWDSKEANIWKFPEPTGNEVFKNGWDIDPKTNALVFKESDVETERRNDGGGGYNPKSDWHWTLPLYTENKPFGTWLDNAIVNNPKKVKDLNFTRTMENWLKNNKTFTEVEKDE